MKHIVLLLICVVSLIYQPLIFGQDNTDLEREQNEFNKYKRFLKMKEEYGDIQKKEMVKVDEELGVKPAKKLNYVVPNLGLVLSDIIGKDKLAFDTKIGVELGFFASLRLSNNLYLCPGIELIGKGAKYLRSTVEINYLQFPILIQYRVINDDWFKLALQAGPYYGVAITRRQTLENGWDDYSSDLSEVVKSSDSGYMIGVSTLWGSFLFEVNYSSSFGSIWNSQDWRNNTITIRGGQIYSF